MTWEVVFSDASKKFLKKLRDAALLDRLLAATTKLASDPGPRDAESSPERTTVTAFVWAITGSSIGSMTGELPCWCW